MRKQKITCENCGTQTTRNNIVRHKKRCSVGTLYCTQCPNFSPKSQNDLNDHIAKKQSAPKLDVTFKCKLCYQEFPGFYALLQHRNTQHRKQMGSGTRDVDVEHIVGDVEKHKSRKELRSCQHFLVDSEIETARHKVINYAVETLNETIVNEKLNHFFSKLNVQQRGIWFWFHFDEYRRWRFQIPLRTQKQYPAGSIQHCVHPWQIDKRFLNKTDVIESCSRERMKTKWRFYKLINLTVFAALLKDLPIGCKNAVLPEPLLKNHTINCLTFEENTRQPYNDNLCLFRALVLQFLDEETSK